MPLIATFHHGNLGNTYLWRIDEEADFFRNTLSQQNLDLTATDGWHPSRQLEWLAGRHLVDVFTSTPLSDLLIMPTGKPYFAHEEEYFSISHSGMYVGLSVSSRKVGLDIQKPSQKMEKLSRKFLHENDIEKSPYDRNRSLHLIWSAKEAIFKCYGEGQVDFKKDLRLEFEGEYLKGTLYNERNWHSYLLYHYHIQQHFIVVAFQYNDNEEVIKLNY